MSPGSYSLPDSGELCPLDTIIASSCIVLQCAEMALRELLTPLFFLPVTVPRLSSVLCPFGSLYFPFFCDYRSSTRCAPDPPALSPLPQSPLFQPLPCCHEMAAQGLSVWFLLSADPISKGPGDPALAPALLLSSPNSRQT